MSDKKQQKLIHLLTIEGISDHSCVKEMVVFLREFDADIAMKVNLENETSQVSTLLSSEQVIAIIQSLGYQARTLAAQSVHFKTEGIKCNNCLKKIRTAVFEHDPSSDVEADIQNKTMVVNSTLATSRLIKVVSGLGFGIKPINTAEDSIIGKNQAESPITASAAALAEVTPAVDQLDSPSSGLQQIHLALEGITCASCVKSVENALNSVAGVTWVNVNFGSRSALISGNEITVEAAVKAIVEAGYGGSEILDPELADQTKELAESVEYKRKIKNTMIGLGLGIPLMVLGMVHEMSVSSLAERALWGLVGLLTLSVILSAGRHFYLSAWKAFKHRNANMDTLIAIGTAAAWSYSMLVVLLPSILPEASRGLYFEAAAMIIGLINLGQALELKARGQTSQAIKRLLGLRAKNARVYRDGGFHDLPINQVEQGDLLQVRPGEQIAVDGEVTQGQSSVDESMLTGEPIPIKKSIGDELSAGTINRNGSLTFKATRIGKSTLLAQIIEMVRTAQNSQPPISRLADQVSAIFVPVVLLISVLTALIWYNFGPAPQLVYMLVTATTVLIIACPCALGLATPISTMIGVGKAAENGILIRSGDALQKASRITQVVVDKTGTLTQGRPTVTDVHFFEEGNQQRTLSLIYALESRSEHPLSEAILGHIAAQEVDYNVTDFQALSGMGLKGEVDGQSIIIGNARCLVQQNIDIKLAQTLARDWQNKARTVVYVAIDGCLQTLFGIADPIKTDALSAIVRLQSAGIKVMMLTGDNPATAATVAKATGIDDFCAQLLPEDKLAQIKKLQACGEVVAMVGDGVNDAPALAQSDVGFAIGTGTDVAIESADITLIRGSLHGISDAIELSRMTLKNIKQNLWGAFAYNAIGIPVAAGVLYPLTGMLLSPVIAGVAMSLSSITVVSNANRLRFFKTSRHSINDVSVQPYNVNKQQELI